MKKYIIPDIHIIVISDTLMGINSVISDGHCSNCQWGDADGDGNLEEFWHCDHSTGWGGEPFYPNCDYYK